MNDTVKGPVDHGDGKPAVSLPPGSFDGDALAAALETVDHDDVVALTDAIVACRVDVVADTLVTMEETGGGYYDLTASWLDAPIRVRGKANAEAERDKLEAAGPPADVAAPIIASVTAPNPDSQILAGLNTDGSDASTEEEVG